MAEKKSAYKILVRKPEERRPFAIPRLAWEDDIKIHLKETGLEVVYWIDLVQVRVQESSEMLL
jgi:hypothetical protein